MTVTRPSLCLSILPTEVTELILGELDLSSLAVCVRTNKVWNSLCIPFLWRTVDINTPQRLERFMTFESQVAFYRNAAHIDNLWLWYSKAYRVFSPLNYAHGPQCNDLRSLHVGLYKDPTRNPRGGKWNRNGSPNRPLDPELESAVAALIRRNPGLKKLTVATYMSPQTLIPLLTHGLPNLQVLDCSNSAYDQCVTKVLLEHLPKSIRSIAMRVKAGNPARRIAGASAIKKQLGLKNMPARQHPALESLELCWTSVPKEEWAPLLVPFLNSCSSKLTTVRIPGLEWFRDRQVREVLDRLGYALTGITFCDVPTYSSCTDALFAEYIGLSNRWRTINFNYCYTVGPLTVRAILHHCEHLQNLNLGHCMNVPSADLQAILAKARYLKTFTVMDRVGRVVGDEAFISANDFIALDWGSLSLEEFRCKIVFPRSEDHCDKNCEEEKAPAGSDTIEVYRSMQRQVYRKLAEQRSLRNLFLGHYPTSPVSQSERWYRSHCLEMTLESGLNELAGLQELVWLDVGGMAPRIGLPELEWMVVHWPHLKYACGILGVGCQDLLPGVCEWFRHNRINWVSNYERRWLCAGVQ